MIMQKNVKCSIIVFLLLAVVAGGVLWGYWAAHGKYYPTKVMLLPAGYVELNETIERTNGVLQYVFFEEYISLIDKNGISVGGSLVRDRKFIVEYQQKYYINAQQFDLALQAAKDREGR